MLPAGNLANDHLDIVIHSIFAFSKKIRAACVWPCDMPQQIVLLPNHIALGAKESAVAKSKASQDEVDMSKTDAGFLQVHYQKKKISKAKAKYEAKVSTSIAPICIKVHLKWQRFADFILLIGRCLELPYYNWAMIQVLDRK